MFMLAPVAVLLGSHIGRAPSAGSPRIALPLAFIHPFTDSRVWWNKGGAMRSSRLPLQLPVTRVSTAAIRARRSTPGEGSAEAASPPADAAGKRRRDNGEGASGGAGDGGGAVARKGTGGGKRRKRDKKSLQERLNEMRLDFSLEDREPYIAGAPPRISALPESPLSGVSPQAAPAAAGSALPANGGGQASYSNYRRRRRPLNALCMPKNQRPPGCAPLLPPMGTGTQRVAMVDHVASELDKIRDLSEFKSDLPCVANGTCPVPSFRCSKGHVWESNGSPVCFYCPVCADTRIMTRVRRKRDLEAMQEIARGKGGECIAKEYLGMDEKIAFRCGDGHEWLTSPANLVYKNTWCPKCAALRSIERKKLTIADMHQTARQFGGVFLSPEYQGAAVKHEWRCKRGHTFWNTPNNVRRAEGGRRIATFCKICTVMDRNILKAAVLGGLSKDDAKSTLERLNAAGAMPTRRHFLKKRATGKSTLAAKRRKMMRMSNMGNVTSGRSSDGSKSASSKSGNGGGTGSGSGGGGSSGAAPSR